jgi:hypothetical protein|tara:strand:- start:4472 stop:4714 length:243 start_codon:yes stop_codon:yes gene_type:complete
MQAVAGFIYKTAMPLLLMAQSTDPFVRAWLMLKTQPQGTQFTEAEKSLIISTLTKAMTSGDPIMEEEASMLFARYIDVQR